MIQKEEMVVLEVQVNEMDALQEYIYISKYARWIEGEKRRETWEETVNRYSNFFCNKYEWLMIEPDFLDAIESIIRLNIAPSMRALMVAGPALDRDNAAGFNCAGRAIDHPRAFDELFYLLMCGCGVGFSVERQFINKMPEVAEEFYESESTIRVRDSKIGWASALRELISLLYAGKIPSWDLSGVRPAGARLKTFGGRASGPEPLGNLFKFTVNLFKEANGRKLNSLECHDLMCMIAETVIVGSVRRSACISFSNLSDDRMRRAKTGEWWIHTPHRKMANNSVMYTEKPDIESFTKEMRGMYRSRSGERGMVNQEALMDKVISCGRDKDQYYILNPCGEAILRSTGGLCNLTEVVVRSQDTLEDLKRKVRYAAILGTLQSILTNFRYLSKQWQRNAEEERLLGISLTGIMDHPVMSGQGRGEQLIGWGDLSDVLRELKQVAYATNKEWSDKLGIPSSKQLTLIKPSGTVSLLVNSSSGIHPRYANYYIRRVTQDIKDPLTDLMIGEKIPHVVDGDKVIFSFPVKAPENSITQKEMDTLSQLELWKIYQEHWCDGNPSQTIYYTDNTFLDMCAWLWKNWDSIGGLSFFPVTNHVYKNAPLEEISEEEYNKMVSSFPNINWGNLSLYEKDDRTTSSKEYACSGGSCEL